ncbi:unnamed protein product [Trichogramma brassicae]|uniref:Uncharacterized protein n=1 Tax=Trichogramma brassicae TaxID=86971 RepID=A0A6H5J0S5_9HYME|nr:unnamed protein product [Trichogramma brassicae]
MEGVPDVREFRSLTHIPRVVVLSVTAQLRVLPRYDCVRRGGMPRRLLSTRGPYSTGLGANPDKLNLVLFSRRHRIDDFRPITFKGVRLEVKEATKYLGVTLERKLRWMPTWRNRAKKLLGPPGRLHMGTKAKVALCFYEMEDILQLAYAAVTKRLLRPRRGSAMPCRCLLVDVGEVRSESTGIGSTPLLARRPSLVNGWWIGAGFRSPRLLLDDLRIGAASRSPTYLARWLVGRRRVSMCVKIGDIRAHGFVKNERKTRGLQQGKFGDVFLRTTSSRKSSPSPDSDLVRRASHPGRYPCDDIVTFRRKSSPSPNSDLLRRASHPGR